MRIRFCTEGIRVKDVKSHMMHLSGDFELELWAFRPDCSYEKALTEKHCVSVIVCWKGGGQSYTSTKECCYGNRYV